MCGIAGACGAGASQMEEQVRRMCDHMVPRGPDDGGVLSISGPRGAVLGARRLAIIDPSAAGHQPFVDRNRGNAIVYNGMIYNYRELRRELEAAGEQFTSDCDTEVVLKCYGAYGPRCVSRLQGMFAFAIWNGERGELFVARDRLGIKPFYYAIAGNQLLFASQIKALLASGSVPPKLSPAGIESFLTFGAVSEPLTALEGVWTLPAGHYATWTTGSNLNTRRYWSVQEATKESAQSDDPVAGLRTKLDQAVASHLVSDVPVGVFLSGGVDSSVIAGIAARHAGAIRAISVVFAESDYSEANYQRIVADRLGCDHIVVELGPSELLADSEAAFAAMDQPTLDAVNTYAVSKAASANGLKVALSGLGADELFNGYDYVRRMRRLEAARQWPRAVRSVVSFASRPFIGGSRSKKAQAWLGGEFPAGASYELLRRLFLPEEVARLRAFDGGQEIPLPPKLIGSRRVPEQVAASDLTNYMKNVLLRDTDAMSMSVSLEVRVPYLDDDVVSWVLADEGRGHFTKQSLVDATSDVVPSEVAQRKKQGFVLPISDWMRGPLQAEVEERFAEIPPAIEGCISREAVVGVWREFLGGRETWTRPWALYALWRWAEGLDAIPTAHAGASTRVGQRFVRAGERWREEQGQR
jgi:asparagine synthase (glutamine-hydrolysing)